MKSFYKYVFGEINKSLSQTDFESLEKISRSLVSINKKKEK